jgi:hypothetical protein
MFIKKTMIGRTMLDFGRMMTVFGRTMLLFGNNVGISVPLV